MITSIQNSDGPQVSANTLQSENSQIMDPSVEHDIQMLENSPDAIKRLAQYKGNTLNHQVETYRAMPDNTPAEREAKTQKLQDIQNSLSPQKLDFYHFIKANYNLQTPVTSDEKMDQIIDHVFLDTLIKS